MTKNNVVIDQSEILSTEKIYNHIYYNQLIEICKFAMGFLLAQMLLRIFDNVLFDFVKDNTFLYVIILIWLTVIIFILTATLFTVSKINNDSDNYYKKITTN